MHTTYAGTFGSSTASTAQLCQQALYCHFACNKFHQPFNVNYYLLEHIIIGSLSLLRFRSATGRQQQLRLAAAGLNASSS
eukprot:6464543-Amphidinium_carterae.5